LVLDARGAEALETVRAELVSTTVVRAVPGDVADEDHRLRLIEAAAELGGLDAVVNNASVLGPSPQPSLEAYPLDVLRGVYEANVFGPLRSEERRVGKECRSR